MTKRILIAPLNWGLGHATRCIPIIKALLQNNYTPTIASDGDALLLLAKEFPDLEALELPSYNIRYPKKGALLKLKLLKDAPHILKAIGEEQKAVRTLIKTQRIDGIISDSRFGVYHETLPSVFITHQLKVLSGNTTWFSTKIHENTIRPFDECWIPDSLGQPNLSGEMGHIDNSRLNLKYIGPLSRFHKILMDPIYDVMILLSGPEPQREILEKKLLEQFKSFKGKVLFVRGVMEKEQTVHTSKNLTIYNFMATNLLEKSLNESRLIVARSGYTTLMDLAKLGKKAFFIPTPGQFEQEYLARKMEADQAAPFCRQDDFTLEQLKRIEEFKGLETFHYNHDFKSLFHLFEGK